MGVGEAFCEMSIIGTNLRVKYCNHLQVGFHWGFVTFHEGFTYAPKKPTDEMVAPHPALAGVGVQF